MSERLRRFMAGRYGTDMLSSLLGGVAVICLLVYMFTRFFVWDLVAMLILVYMMFRMFSRNIPKRAAENQIILNARYSMMVWLNKRSNHHEQRKIYHFYRCPQCRQKIRVPRGKGKIMITCPKCKKEFIKNS